MKMEKNDFAKDSAVIYQRYKWTPEWQDLMDRNDGDMLDIVDRLLKNAPYPCWKINQNNFSDEEILELDRAGFTIQSDFENNRKYEIVSDKEITSVDQAKRIVRYLITL